MRVRPYLDMKADEFRRLLDEVGRLFTDTNTGK